MESVGYKGYFQPKPDSPCLYVDDNNGPDGCAMFYKTDRFQCDSVHTRVLSVWQVTSNQVAMSALLTTRDTGAQFCVATTHLKARCGDINMMMRAEQGRDLVTWLDTVTGNTPVILTGDLNAEPSEPVLGTLTSHDTLDLVSAYEQNQSQFTTCKIRQSGKETKTLDYILTTRHLTTAATLSLPSEHQLGPTLLPSPQCPSDHLSLFADIVIN